MVYILVSILVNYNKPGGGGGKSNTKTFCKFDSNYYAGNTYL